MNRIPVITGMAGVICREDAFPYFHRALDGNLTNHQLLDMAFSKAISDSEIELGALQGNQKVGIIIGTTSGMFYEQSLFLKEFYETGRRSPALFSQTAHNYLADTIVSKYQLQGFSTCLFNGWTSSLDAIQLGCHMIRNGSMDTVMIGSVDVLNPYILSIYDRMLGSSEKICYKTNDFSLQGGSGVIIIEAGEKALHKSFHKKKDKGIISGGGQSSFYSEAEFAQELEHIIQKMNPENCYYANLNHTNLDIIEIRIIKKYCLRGLNCLKLRMGEYGAVSGILQIIDALSSNHQSSLLVNACYSGRLSWLVIEKHPPNHSDVEE